MIHQINFAKKPIPKGTEKLKSGDDWISWGDDNLFPQFLVELFYESAYNNGIIETKVKYITSAGFSVEGSDESKAVATKFFNNGSHDKSIDDILKKACLDLEIFGGFALKIARKFDGSFGYIDNMDFSSIRVNEDKSQIYFSNNWASGNQSEDQTGLKQYSDFEPNDDDQLVSVLYYSQPSMAYGLQRSKQTYNVYPQPPYSGCIKDICTDVEISSFHYYEMVNGMKTGTMVTFTNGEPPADEKRELVSKYKDGMTNTENSGSIYLNFVKGQEQLPQIDSLMGNDLDKRYLMLSEDVRKKIMVGHSVVSGALFTVETAGTMGSNQQLATAWEIFKKTYVREKQTILESVFNYVLASFGYSVKIAMNESEMPFQLEGQTPQPNQPTTVQPQQQSDVNFSDEMVKHFSSCGADKSDFKIHASREIDFGTPENETEFKSMYKTDNFQLETAEIMILNMIREGENISSIANALDLTEAQIVRLYTSLKNRGYIDANGNVTSLGLDEINDVGTVVPEIRYSYELRSDAPDLVAGGTSRNFCLAVMGMNRLWTREEIDNLTALTPTGLSAWAYRGGWYHNPNTDRNELGCRHTWVQNIVTPLNN